MFLNIWISFRSGSCAAALTAVLILISRLFRDGRFFEGRDYRCHLRLLREIQRRYATSRQRKPSLFTGARCIPSLVWIALVCIGDQGNLVLSTPSWKCRHPTVNECRSSIFQHLKSNSNPLDVKFWKIKGKYSVSCHFAKLGCNSRLSNATSD